VFTLLEAKPYTAVTLEAFSAFHTEYYSENSTSEEKSEKKQQKVKYKVVPQRMLAHSAHPWHPLLMVLF